MENSSIHGDPVSGAACLMEAAHLTRTVYRMKTACLGKDVELRSEDPRKVERIPKVQCSEICHCYSSVPRLAF